MMIVVWGFVVVLEGRAAIQQLQSVAEEFEKGKLEIATTADVQVAGVQGECHFITQIHRIVYQMRFTTKFVSVKSQR